MIALSFVSGGKWGALLMSDGRPHYVRALKEGEGFLIRDAAVIRGIN